MASGTRHCRLSPDRSFYFPTKRDLDDKKNNWLLTAVQIGMPAWSGATLVADKVYEANEGTDTVSVLDVALFKTLANFRVGKMPHKAQVSPDGKLVWAANNGEPGQAVDTSAHKGMAKGDHDAMGKPRAICAIDTTSDAVVAKVPVDMHPAHVVVSPDGRFAYVTNGGNNTVSVIDTWRADDACSLLFACKA